MKSILLVRHAKSSWNAGVKDFDRPLNHHGLSDAPAMAEKIFKKDIKIDAFVSSPANRAFSTAVFFAKAYGQKSKEIITIPKLYEPSVDAFRQVIKELNNLLTTIAIFSHNPGITDFANSLTSTKIDDMPTCSIFAVKTAISNWSAFIDKPSMFWFFDYPKA